MGKKLKSKWSWPAFASLILLIVAVIVHFRIWDPIPSLSEVSNDEMITRRYDTLLLPLKGRSIAAIRSQLEWKLKRSGEARLYSLAMNQASNVEEPLTEAFREAGYEFPLGSSAKTRHTVAGVYIEICHYPAMLDHLERTFQLTRKPARTKPATTPTLPNKTP